MNHIEFYEKNAFNLDLDFDVRHTMQKLYQMTTEQANEILKYANELMKLKNEDVQALGFYTKMSKLDKELRETNVINF